MVRYVTPIIIRYSVTEVYNIHCVQVLGIEVFNLTNNKIKCSNSVYISSVSFIVYKSSPIHMYERLVEARKLKFFLNFHQDITKNVYIRTSCR